LSPRELTIRLIASALTFLLGLGVALPFKTQPAPRTSAREMGSACELLQKGGAGLYENVRLSGVLYGNDDGTFVFNETDCTGNGMWMNVGFDDSLLRDAEVARFVERMRRQSRGSTMARAEVVITGRLNKADGTPPFLINITRLEWAAPSTIVSFVSN
jgi:hypothetical protein